MLAWLSATGDAFNCNNCLRSNFTCPKQTPKIDKDSIMGKLKQSNLPSTMPTVFKLEQMGICPKSLLSEFGILVGKCYKWWEKGQLGLTLLDAPMWVDDALSQFEYHLGKAREFTMKNRGNK